MATPERAVLRTHVEFFYGTWEIICAMADQSFRCEKAEELLSFGRQQAQKMLKLALHAHGLPVGNIDPHDVVYQSDFVVDGKPITKKTFVGLLSAHVQKLFPELV